MMAIADIFDALAAADRPYKSSVSVERALEILEQMAQEGEIDRRCSRYLCRRKCTNAGRKSASNTNKASD